MSEPQLISPLLDGFVMGDPFSNREGIRCCPALHLETNKKYIVKMISIPSSPKKMAALILAGAFTDRASAIPYFKELTDSIVEEVALLQRLSKAEGYVGFEAWQVVPMDDAGFDIYLLSPYRPTLETAIHQQELTHLAAINLGLDLSAALCAARQAGYLYCDLNPGNIYLTKDREYRIGDLGFISLESLPYTSLPENHLNDYTAPEISDAFSALNLTIDTYALGVILYQIYNGGKLPSIGPEIEAPEYADAELAQIILKACAFLPEDRWQDPMQLGQALITYLQSHSVNDEVIVPPAAVSEPEVAEVEESDEPTEPTTQTILDEVDEALDAASIIVTESNDAINETDSSEIISENTEQILAQADDLICHQLPDPVIPPEAVEIVLPVPQETAEEPRTQDLNEENSQAETDASSNDDQSNPENKEQQSATPSKKISKRLLAGIIAAACVLALILGGVLFYRCYYIQTINSIILSGSEDHLSVTLDSDIANGKLTVKCTDTYGNSMTRDVVDNVAVFEGLKPDTTYNLEVRIQGFHKLMGQTTEQYTTAKHTTINGLQAITGQEDGSVILNFTIQGPDSAKWQVAYTADGEESKTITFVGHTVNITGLTIGKEYALTVKPVSELYLTGQTELTHLASEILYAQNLQVLGFKDHNLTVTWDAPSDISVPSWIVRCYNDAGYDKTIVTEDTTTVFEQLDITAGYTVEVKAANMTLGVRTFLTANSITIFDAVTDITNPNELKVQWQFEGSAPEEGWLLLYTIDGDTQQQVVQCSENSGSIVPLIPGAHYSIVIKPGSGVSYFGQVLEFDAPEAEAFNSYDITAENVQYLMCKTPNVTNWNYEDVASNDYVTTFAPGDSASFVLRLNKETEVSDEEVTALFVIRDTDGNLVSNKYESRTWDSMWYQNNGKLTIPTMPEAPGSYCVEVYFNGAAVLTQEFEIQSAE